MLIKKYIVKREFVKAGNVKLFCQDITKKIFVNHVSGNVLFKDWLVGDGMREN
jgi:hypothetical protein|tara:strand:- start:407 stop:565 length:159 start_codon:yes stop_codon:yes gene_type:complete